LFGFYEKIEIDTLKRIFGKWRHPKDLVGNIRGLLKS